MAVKELLDQYGAGKIRLNHDGKTAIRVFLTDWAERETGTPALDETYPGDKSLRVSDIEIEGSGVPTGSSPPTYSLARVTVRYSSYETQHLQRWMESSVSYEIGALGAEWKTVKDASGNPTYNYQGITLIHPRMVYAWEAERTTLNFSSYYTLLGKINSDSFHSHARRTLLYCGVQTRERRTSRGGIVYRYTHRALVKPDGWNRFPVPGIPGTTDELDPSPYGEASFARLL